jgi:hypothetical protein
MVDSSVLPPNTPLVGSDGRVTNEWYRFFVSLSKTADGASAGDVATNPGSGLAGGGTVADGVSLSIADNGVTNSKIRQSEGNSVIGRTSSSNGNVADIVAGLNNTTLVRQGNQTFFSEHLAGASIEVNETPTASAATTTHYIPITIGGVDYKMLLST